ncbi:MAG: hypothetical protein LC802_19190 [Acidobacteria bacterium]|nr:hypothetical protein [Acidobacteriota bacterium]
MSSDESSLEFDMFEEMRRTLSHMLIEEGRDPIEAERISFYVMQGLRDVPKLLNALGRAKKPFTETLGLLKEVLENTSSLDKARALLLGPGDDQVMH